MYFKIQYKKIKELIVQNGNLLNLNHSKILERTIIFRNKAQTLRSLDRF